VKNISAALLALLSLPGIATAQNVTTYHNANTRQGTYVVPGLTQKAAKSVHLDPGFSAALSGHIYAQPLYWQKPGDSTGSLIVPTENNIVYALNAATGAVIWQTQLAAAAPLSAFPCGNINPEGVTGTPVIDAASGTLYLNALTQTGSNTPAQLIYAISLRDGTIRPGWPIDVAAALTGQGFTFSSLDQGERSAALVFEKNVYFVYGGKSGDCGSYHGTVVQVDRTNASITGAWATQANGGGIWSQGGIAGDGKSLFVATGNTIGARSYGEGEGVFRLKPGLAQSTDTHDYFAPVNWQTLDQEDADLGGTEALPIDVPNGGKTQPRILALGKDGNAYLVNRNNLGGISAPVARVAVSGASIITGPAVLNTPAATLVAFTNRSGLNKCTGNSLTMLSVVGNASPPINQAWCASFSGAGAPIITTTDGTSEPLVWVVGAAGDNLLHAYDALTGKQVFNGAGIGMSGLHGFQTIMAAANHLYVAADGTIYAFTFGG
jgi:outer membrane protein assembly factor BamB